MDNKIKRAFYTLGAFVALGASVLSYASDVKDTRDKELDVAKSYRSVRNDDVSTQGGIELKYSSFLNLKRVNNILSYPVCTSAILQKATQNEYENYTEQLDGPRL